MEGAVPDVTADTASAVVEQLFTLRWSVRTERMRLIRSMYMLLRTTSNAPDLGRKLIEASLLRLLQTVLVDATRDQSYAEAVKTMLGVLYNLPVTIADLQAVTLGKEVNKLTKSTDPQVKLAATKLKNRWAELVVGAVGLSIAPSPALASSGAVLADSAPADAAPTPVAAPAAALAAAAPTPAATAAAPAPAAAAAPTTAAAASTSTAAAATATPSGGAAVADLPRLLGGLRNAAAADATTAVASASSTAALRGPAPSFLPLDSAAAADQSAAKRVHTQSDVQPAVAPATALATDTKARAEAGAGAGTGAAFTGLFGDARDSESVPDSAAAAKPGLSLQQYRLSRRRASQAAIAAAVAEARAQEAEKAAAVSTTDGAVRSAPGVAPPARKRVHFPSDDRLVKVHEFDAENVVRQSGSEQFKAMMHMELEREKKMQLELKEQQLRERTLLEERQRAMAPTVRWYTPSVVDGVVLRFSVDANGPFVVKTSVTEAAKAERLRSARSFVVPSASGGTMIEDSAVVVSVVSSKTSIIPSGRLCDPAPPVASAAQSGAAAGGLLGSSLADALTFLQQTPGAAANSLPAQPLSPVLPSASDAVLPVAPVMAVPALHPAVQPAVSSAAPPRAPGLLSAAPSAMPSVSPGLLAANLVSLASGSSSSGAAGAPVRTSSSDSGSRDATDRRRREREHERERERERGRERSPPRRSSSERQGDPGSDKADHASSSPQDKEGSIEQLRGRLCRYFRTRCSREQDCNFIHLDPQGRQWPTRARKLRPEEIGRLVQYL